MTKPTESAASGFHFEKIDAERAPGRHQSRKGSKATVRPTGHMKMTVGATEESDDVAREVGITSQEYNLILSGDRQNGLAGLYPVPTGTPKSVPTRRDKSTGVLITYLEELFEKLPVLKVETRRQCAVFRTTDQNGDPCIAVSLGTGLKQARQSKVGSGKQSKQKTEAAAPAGGNAAEAK